MKSVDAKAQLDHLEAGLNAPPVKAPTADGGGGLPAEVSDWLVQLRLLQSVPFAYLVADEALLPPESIRWFYLDRRWTDALVMGALSVGTVNSDDRILLTSHYPAIRDALDARERTVRQRDSRELSGDGGPISGFLLRSRAVAGWPALHVRAFSVDPAEGDAWQYGDDDDGRRVRLVRLERLAPAVLLCLFDGIPEVVHLEEPRQGIQFGFDTTTKSGVVSASVPARHEQTFEDLGGPPVPVPFRKGATGVVNLEALGASLLERAGSTRASPSATTPLNSAEYALQLLRFPYRQVWGDTPAFDVDSVFHPTVSYDGLTHHARTGGGS